LPTEYRNHLALYEGISAEHSSIDEIVQKARRYEKILVTLRPGRTGERDNTPVSYGRRQEARVERSGQHSRPKTFRQQRGPTDQQHRQRPVQNPPPRERRDGRESKAPLGKTDASKLSCYKCGQIGHFSNDPKCPQYKKPEKRQMFAAQVVDDLSDKEASSRVDDAPRGEALMGSTNPDDDSDSGVRAGASPKEDNGPDGSQYSGDSQEEDSYVDEYDELKAAQGSQLPEARQEEGPSLESRIGALELRDQIDTVREREFRTAHNHTESAGKRPNLSGVDRRCMAVHVKVNGLDAYTLLDTGCTTVSITPDFARVAKLRVMQLENPVKLQLGTVGSRSVINFGAVSRIELGSIND
ncbi:hypothetical protein BC826DRAFT_875195, partial [Russula brevipes]